MVQISSLAPQDVNVLLVGNKVDLDSERVVSTDEGRSLANQYNIAFYEASAKSGYNVSEIFHSMGVLLLDKVDQKRDNDSERTSQNVSAETINSNNIRRKTKCCKGGM